jgi:hypothetical protein
MRAFLVQTEADAFAHEATSTVCSVGRAVRVTIAPCGTCLSRAQLRIHKQWFIIHNIVMYSVWFDSVSSCTGVRVCFRHCFSAILIDDDILQVLVFIIVYLRPAYLHPEFRLQVAELAAVYYHNNYFSSDDIILLFFFFTFSATRTENDLTVFKMKNWHFLHMVYFVLFKSVFIA